MEGQWLLFISPAESMKGIWEARVFSSFEELDKFKNGADLTKEHYFCSVSQLVEDFRNAFEQ
jgi:hypothetical protein